MLIRFVDRMGGLMDEDSTLTYPARPGPHRTCTVPSSSFWSSQTLPPAHKKGVGSRYNILSGGSGGGGGVTG